MSLKSVLPGNFTTIEQDTLYTFTDITKHKIEDKQECFTLTFA